LSGTGTDPGCAGAAAYDAHGAVEAAFRAHERYLWALLFRMTGCAADADDLIQETFVRALESPPPDLAAPLRAWLVRVAMNLGRDCLRRRRRAGYTGPWLPSAVAAEETLPSYEIADREGLSTEGRYDLIESVSFAFLLALEALTPAQRAVLLLRDVFDYASRETADALGMSEANVRTTHHRARKAMSGYERRRTVPDARAKARTAAALAQLVSSVMTGDVAAVEAMLAADVREMSDGGGEYLAARKTIFGPNRVARYLVGIAPTDGVASNARVRELNGLPALVLDLNWGESGRRAPHVVLACDVDEDGCISAVYTVLASRKLTEVARMRALAQR
jgi:RNA polymerase sigma-70 factor (ECF subfamily)